MDGVLVEEVGRNTQLLRAGAHVGQRGLRAFAHHLAKLSGDLQLLVALHDHRLDKDDIAADLRPDHASADTGLIDAFLRLVEEARATQRCSHEVGRDHHWLVAFPAPPPACA